MKTGDCPLVLDVDRIGQSRQDHFIGRRIVLYQSTASTNDVAWEYARNPDNHGLCVLAESQHKGRGRRGRTWYSQPGQSILCSVLLTQTTQPAELLALAAAVATAEAILESCTLPCRIKWPNDILIHNQKVAGILLEKRVQNGRDIYVIGIGINCNQTAEAFEDCQLNLPATSLAIQAGRPIDRTALVCELLAHLERWLDNPQRQIIQRWLTLSGMLGRHVTVECNGIRYGGFCRGVDPDQGLILQLDRGLIRMFAAAQTSLVIE